MVGEGAEEGGKSPNNHGFEPRSTLCFSERDSDGRSWAGSMFMRSMKRDDGGCNERRGTVGV